MQKLKLKEYSVREIIIDCNEMLKTFYEFSKYINEKGVQKTAKEKSAAIKKFLKEISYLDPNIKLTESDPLCEKWLALSDWTKITRHLTKNSLKASISIKNQQYLQMFYDIFRFDLNYPRHGEIYYNLATQKKYRGILMSGQYWFVDETSANKAFTLKNLYENDQLVECAKDYQLLNNKSLSELLKINAKVRFHYNQFEQFMDEKICQRPFANQYGNFLKEKYCKI